MFAKVIANLDGADLTGYGSSRFSDVPVGEWYHGTVEWAADNGIIAGVGAGRFDPNAGVTREQMAVMLNNYMSYKGFILPSKAFTEFADSGRISPWAFDAVKAVQAAGIINGRSGGLFDPSNTTTRAEGSVIFRKLIELAALRN